MINNKDLLPFRDEIINSSTRKKTIYNELLFSFLSFLNKIYFIFKNDKIKNNKIFSSHKSTKKENKESNFKKR